MSTPYVVPAAEQLPPPGFQAQTFSRTFDLEHSREAVWGWLNDPQTFVRGQPWPYFVEFLDGGFQPGVRNTHSGPLLHCAGVVGDVRAPEYRDLVYLYGAFVLRMKWIRPARLQFWVEENGSERARVRVQLDSHVKPWIAGIWAFGQRFFWSLFGWSMRAGVKRRERGNVAAAATARTSN